MKRGGSSGARPGWVAILPVLALAVLLPRAEGAPSVASLGNRIVFVAQTAVLAVSLDGTRTRLTPRDYPPAIWGDINSEFPGEILPYDVAVSPDGSRVVFSSDPGDAPADLDGELFSVGADGSDLRRLTFTRELETKAVYSPDGSKLAVLRDAAVDEVAIRLDRSRISVVVMNSDGTDARVLAKAPRGAVALDMELAWHPDSERLLFRYEHRVRPTISLINTSSGARQALHGSYAEFSPDGKLLAVLYEKTLGYEDRPDPPRIYVGTVTRFTKSGFTRTKPLVSSVRNRSGHLVFTLFDFSWFSDGRIAYLGPDKRGAGRCPRIDGRRPQTLVGVVNARGRQRVLRKACGYVRGMSASPSGTAFLSWHQSSRVRLDVFSPAAWRPRTVWNGNSERAVWGYEPTSKSEARRHAFRLGWGRP